MCIVKEIELVASKNASPRRSVCVESNLDRQTLLSHYCVKTWVDL